MNVSIPGTSASGVSQIWSGASPAMAPDQKMSNLFDQIDSSSSGSITHAQFGQAFQALNPPASFQAAGPGAVWNSLDPKGSGSVSRENFVSGMTALMRQLRSQSQASSTAGAQALAQETSQMQGLGSTAATGNAAGSGPAGNYFDSVA